MAATADTAQDRMVEDQRDRLEDFDLMQMMNTELLTKREAAKANRDLQRDATTEYTGFVEIKYKSIRVGSSIGSGAFGAVFSAKYSKCNVAIKVVDGNTLHSAAVTALRRELRVLTSEKAKHPNIIELYGASTVAPKYALVMEYAPNGTLHDLLHKPDKQSERSQITAEQRLQMLYDIAAPLHHLHNNSIVHGDVKPTNMLLFNDHRIKICDFGLSTVINSVGPQSTNGDQPRGTAGYMAREVLTSSSSSSSSSSNSSSSSSSSSITPASDVYSYGMVMYEVITGIKPYANLRFETIHAQLLQGAHPAITADSVYGGCTSMQPLMEKCWQHDATARQDLILVRF
jgi:serine/threonine protein kinase